MIERILKHMNIYKEMKNAAIPLKLIGKKGEDFCMNAARLVNQQELSGLMEGLNEETISSLMDDPEILSYLGKMNKKDFSILEPDRIRMVIECAGNEKLSEFPYEKIEKVLADKEIPDRIVYVYLKYYAFLEPKEELKKQLVASLETCIGEFDVARAGIKIRMLLINPAFSTELLYELLKDEESLALLLKQDLMELVNYLSEFCKETESLNKKQLEELSRHPKEIRNGLEVILTQIPKEWQASFLHLWLWNESLYADIPKLIRFLTGPDADFKKISNGKAAYVNTLYGNPLPDIDLYELTLEKTELILYAITKRKKHFLELLRKNGDWLINLDRNSLILDEEVYKRCLNLNTLNEQNLRDCEYMVVPWRKSEESLFSKPRVFEELKILYNVKAVYIDLYDRLAYSKSDDRLRVIRELIKRDCLTDALEENQVERLAEALSKKSLSRWMQEDFKNILDLRHETAIWILIFLMDFTELLKELTRDNQVYFLLHNQNLLNGCSGLPALMDKLLAQDSSWKNLKTELNISDAFVAENKSNIQKFIYEGGAEIMTSFLNRQPKKKEEIRRIVNAELLGKFMELKYHGGDLGREIAFPIKKDTEEIWEEKLLRVDCGWEIWEEDSLLPVMQIGEVPLRSCISYRNGPNCDCLLSCFDANKKIIFIKHNGKIVFRAILRLTKGSFVAADERKTIEFVDVTVKSEPHENKAEELVLFLERYYQSGLSEQEIRKAVNITAMLVKEKAEKLGARLVLSSSYKNVLENKNYVLTNFYMYISASKNGSQYLDSLGGVAGVSASGSYTCNTFLLEAEERRKESL